jgi:dUTP pyrophosphatase
MKFEFIEKYAAAGLTLPERKTSGAAGYDFVIAEDTVIPSSKNQLDTLWGHYCLGELKPPLTLQEVAALTKYTKAKPTLVPTGVKC